MIMTSLKIKGWGAKLMDLHFDLHYKPFKWGVQDCMTLACDSIKVMTGIDPMANWLRGQYSTKYEAIELVHNHFGLSFLGTFASIFEVMGFELSDKLERGDIAFIRIDNIDKEAAEMFGGVTLATVFNDVGHVVCPGKDGLVVIEKFDLVRAWTL
jgi:hypothetical protein